MIPVIMLLLLLAFPSISINGARQGLLLWSNVVLPTLAPFMICTQLITALGGIRTLTRPFTPVFRHIYHLSNPGGYILLCGLLCGYPLGARLCSEFEAKDLISETEAQYLLSICNHPSPMFLLGYVMQQMQGNLSTWTLLLCLYLPILPISLIARAIYQTNSYTQRKFLIQERFDKKEHRVSAKRNPFSIEEILLSTCETLVIIGGYIMLFSILTVWIEQIPFLTDYTKASLCGIAEITTGIHKLCSCDKKSLPFLTIIATIAFGGLSGIFQTRSVLMHGNTDSCTSKNAGLSIRHYVVWKLLHAFFSCITFILLQKLPLPW